MNRRHTVLSSKLSFIILAMSFALSMTQAYAQTPWQSSAVPVQTTEGSVLVLPDNATLPEQLAGASGTRVSIALEGDYRVYRARHKGKDHHVHVALDGPTRRLAFDLERGRFRDVLQSVRIEMDNYANFNDLVERAGGTGGKVYEPLGFALILLPENLNPAEVAAELAALPSVKRATIELQGPLYVPM